MDGLIKNNTDLFKNKAFGSSFVEKTLTFNFKKKYVLTLNCLIPTSFFQMKSWI